MPHGNDVPKASFAATSSTVFGQKPQLPVKHAFCSSVRAGSSPLSKHRTVYPASTSGRGMGASLQTRSR